MLEVHQQRLGSVGQYVALISKTSPQKLVLCSQGWEPLPQTQRMSVLEGAVQTPC